MLNQEIIGLKKLADRIRADKIFKKPEANGVQVGKREPGEGLVLAGTRLVGITGFVNAADTVLAAIRIFGIA